MSECTNGEIQELTLKVKLLEEKMKEAESLNNKMEEVDASFFGIVEDD